MNWIQSMNRCNGPILAPRRTQADLGITHAVWDFDGWVLSNEHTDCVEQWPSDWPETVTADFLRRRGVQVVIA